MRRSRTILKKIILGVTGVAVALAVSGMTANLIDHYSKPSPSGQPRQLTEEYAAITREQVWAEANKHRDEPLPLDPTLNETAQAKCDKIVSTGIDEHGDLLAELSHLNRHVYGENLAESFTTAKDVVQAWTNSPAHNANLVDADWGRVGYGICYSTTLKTVIVQQFSD